MKNIILLICLLHIAGIFAQNRTPESIFISGTVYGYNFDPSVKLINNDKSEIEGSLSGVTIAAYDGANKLAGTKSSSNGTFQFIVPANKSIKIEYAKDGYVTATFNINLANVPTDIKASGLIFENIEIALNHHVSSKTDDNRPFGNVYYNTTTKALDFEAIIYKDKKKLFGDNQDDTPINLMKKSVKKNVTNNAEAVVNTNEMVEQKSENNTVKVNHSNTSNQANENNVVIDQSGQTKQVYVMPKFDFSKMSANDISDRQNEIDIARKQLEQDKLLAITPEDFALIQAREELLNAAEKELENAKEYIALQDKEIAAQNFKIILLLALLVVLAVSLFIIVRYAKQKNALNKELAAKNKKIMESIRYALRIQQSVLLPENEFKKILPGSFILYKPLDVVSGDFYWIVEVQNKVVLVVADCTGHGVPGAFMSLIGNTLLNHIVNEKGVVDPGQILDELHQGIIYSLRQAESDENNQDGMDVAVCLIDKNSGTVSFSGAMNPVYFVEEGEFKILEPTLKAVGGIEKRKKRVDLKFNTTQIKPAKGTTFLMTSDGFMDQFGGPEALKYNLPKFKETAQKINSKNSAEQLSIFEKSFNDWKGNNKQVDDVLLVGFTI